MWTCVVVKWSSTHSHWTWRLSSVWMRLCADEWSMLCIRVYVCVAGYFTRHQVSLITQVCHLIFTLSKQHTRVGINDRFWRREPEPVFYSYSLTGLAAAVSQLSPVRLRYCYDYGCAEYSPGLSNSSLKRLELNLSTWTWNINSFSANIYFY